MLKRLLFVLIAIALGVTTASADEPLMQELQRRFQSDPLTLGALLQVVGNYETGDSALVNDGFALANLRVLLYGQLDEGWGYFLQTSFIKAPALLDASLRYRRWKQISFEAGAFKAPFSAEFLTFAGNIDFVNRSQAATLLAPGRQVGIAVRGEFENGLGYAVAALNGNGLRITNDDDRLMAAGRLSYSDTFEGGALLAAVNAYHSHDTDAPIGVPITGSFIAQGYSGERMGYGADVRMTYRPWLLAAEFIGSRFDPRGSMRVEPNGYNVTAGYKPTEKTQALLRWDSFSGDGAVSDSDLIIFGFNYWPTLPTEIQLNAVVPTQESRDFQMLVNIQVSF